MENKVWSFIKHDNGRCSDEFIYNFTISASKYSLEILNDRLTKSKNKTVKNCYSDTLWSSRNEACLSLSKNCTELLKVLNGFVKNPIVYLKTTLFSC